MIDKIKEDLLSSKAVIILAGAGFSSDSGMPTFRGENGFWKAYPALVGRDFESVASPNYMHENPESFIGFYLHRLNMYKDTVPHSGYVKLRDFLESNNIDYFVRTTNVDGHFKKAGYREDNIEEIHGNINHWQCSNGFCKTGILPPPSNVEVDDNLMASSLPRCPLCNDLARPNILMFDDYMFDHTRVLGQARKYNNWLDKHYDCEQVTILEFGAGTGVPTLRYIHSSYLRDHPDWRGYRVNTEDEPKSSSVNLRYVNMNSLNFIDKVTSN